MNNNHPSSLHVAENDEYTQDTVHDQSDEAIDEVAEEPHIALPYALARRHTVMVVPASSGNFSASIM
jgi:hypothetical protein